MTRLQDLHSLGGQSPWLDNLKRAYLTSGRLQELVSQGVRGLTSNPTIMFKAISAGADYDEQFSSVLSRGATVEDAYWTLVTTDVAGALSVLRPVYDESDGADGFVSVEVSPYLAHDTRGTAESARELHELIDEPNLMVKIPATVEGLPAIEAMVAEGHNINVTLIFSLERYRAVIEAYLSGLEKLVAKKGDPTRVASVASFFVSRVDTEIDRRLEEIAASNPRSPRGDRALELRGTAALAQARLAYRVYLEAFSGPRWEALAEKGARPQRPLWASTSTKNPAYPDLKYVDGLVTKGTVNTIPEDTLVLVLDHGAIEPISEVDLDRAQSEIDALAEAGIDIPDVARVLEAEGIASFATSFDDVIAGLYDKAGSLGVSR
ncbi:MAG: transaldolase [Acidimicrobiales bacterium]|jgi:transaldolase